MIKTFEQFIFDKYNEPVNEAFQSNKLREIIKQHGKPKWSFEYKMLYDIKDNEIIDVLDNRSEYWEKYSNRKSNLNDKSEATFMLELEDGACVVISNLGVLKNFFGDDPEKKIKDIFKQRHSERHKGNLGKYGELDIQKKHRENVNKLLSKRLLEKIQSNLDEFIKKIKSIWDDVDISIFDFEKESETYEIDYEFSVGDDEYIVYITYECGCESIGRGYGVENVRCHIRLETFEISDEDGGVVYSKDLDIPKDVLNGFYREWKEDGEIYDYYTHFGVSPSDFF